MTDINKFIKLTSTEQQEETAIVLDVDQITAVEQGKNHGKCKTRILTATGRVWFVKETYFTVVKCMDEIYNTLGY